MMAFPRLEETPCVSEGGRHGVSPSSTAMRLPRTSTRKADRSPLCPMEQIPYLVPFSFPLAHFNWLSPMLVDRSLTPAWQEIREALRLRLHQSRCVSLEDQHGELM